MFAIFRRQLLFASGLIVGCGFLLLALRNVETSDIVAAFHDFNVFPILVIVISRLIFFAVETYRWRLLLDALGTVNRKRLFSLTVWAYAANLLVPHTGELGRGYALSRIQKYPIVGAMAVMTVERIFDFLAVLIMLVVALWTAGDTSPIYVRAAFLLGLIVVIGLFVAATIVKSTDRLNTWALGLPDRMGGKLLKQLTRQLTSLRSAWPKLRQIRLLARVAALTVVLWCLLTLAIHSSFAAIDITPAPYVSFIVLAILFAALTLPAAPAQVGTIQLCFVFGAASQKVPDAQAIAASIVFHVVIVTVTCSLALIMLFIHHRATDQPATHRPN